ncbi:MAG: DUF2142 domain-containing protein [Actinomycetota bacterium]|nr:DUF2142 domain-containing protein [Actinomycetota bacterium]
MLTGEEISHAEGKHNYLVIWRGYSTFLFASLLLIIIGLCTILTPPFQVPDTPVHFMKAASLSYGGLVPVISSKQAGYPLPESISQFVVLFTKIPFHIAVKATYGEFSSALHLSWAAPKVFTAFTSASFDPPFLYLPDILGIWTGRLFGFSILTTYYLAELVSSVFCAVLLSFSFALSKTRARILIATLSFLPMSVSLFGSVSRDALLLPLTVLAFVLASRPMEPTARPSWRNWITRLVPTLLILPVAMTKPPYVFLLLAIGLLSYAKNRRILNIVANLAPFLLGVVVTGLWYVFSSSSLSTTMSDIPGISPSRQLHLIFAQPFSFLITIVRTIRFERDFYFHSTIGTLGWLDTSLPNWTFVVMGLFLVWSVSLLIFGIDRRAPFLIVFTRVIAAFILGFIGTEAALYVTSTGFKGPIVLGVQGRYFLPLIPLFLLLPQRDFRFLPKIENAEKYVVWLSCLYLVGFAALSAFATAGALIPRFWLN